MDLVASVATTCKCNRGSAFEQSRVPRKGYRRGPSGMRGRVVGIGSLEGRPELSLILSGIAAHCDPTLRRDCGLSALGCVSGVASGKPNRTIRIRHGGRPAGRCSFHGNSAFCVRRPRGVSGKPERHRAGGAALVLSYRPRHQTPMLVPARADGKEHRTGRQAKNRAGGRLKSRSGGCASRGRFSGRCCAED